MADPEKGFVERLFAEHRRALQAYFYRRIRKKSDVADLTQEVYLRMLRVGNSESIRRQQSGEGARDTGPTRREASRHR
jgi:DNA-directed RNA polymerase specialized sigma24 family protein